MPLLVAVMLFFGSCIQATGSRAKTLAKANLTGAKSIGSVKWWSRTINTLAISNFFT